MTYTIALQVPELPITEEWTWTTDVQVSYDGNEDRIPLNRYPRRKFSGEYVFTDMTSVRRHMAFMFKGYRNQLQLPLYQHHVKLKAGVSAGATSVSVNSLRSDFRVGQSAFIIEGGEYEVVEVDAIAADSVTFTTPLANDYSKRATVCPLTIAFSEGAGSAARFNPDTTAKASFAFEEYSRWPGIVQSFNTETLVTYDGFAVLEANAVGSQFETASSAGMTVNDYIGQVDLSNSWVQSKLDFALRWQVNKLNDLSFWNWWFVFLDHIQGSYKEFLIPSHRDDLTPSSLPNGGEAQIEVLTNEYSDHYWPLDTFKRIVVESSAGRHYATVTGVTVFTGVDRLIFTPALPAGPGWDIDTRVEYLTKVRVADDKVRFVHHALHTEVSLVLRTVP